MIRDLSPILPDVEVHFRGRRCSGSPSDSTPFEYVKTILLADVLADLELSDEIPEDTIGSPGVKVMHDTALALYTVGGPDPTNQEALDALAKQLAIDFLDWRTVYDDEVYNGIIAPDQNGIIEVVEWCYDGDDCYTRITSKAPTAEPEEFSHNDPANAGCVDSTGVVVAQTPCAVYYGPPVACVAGKLTLTRYKDCIEDGRLYTTFVSTDTIS